jgi:hypothetical protein
MNVKPVLGSWEIPFIAYISSLEQRNFVELPVPGKTGSLYQDTNTAPTRIVIHGSLFGDDKRNQFMDEVRTKYKTGDPLTFVADIITATDVQYVVIESLQFWESGLSSDQTDYTIVLRESPPPPPPPSPLGDMDSSLLEQGQGLVDSVSGALDVIDGLGSVPDLVNPTPPLQDALGSVQKATDGIGDVLSPLVDIFGKS